MSWVEPLKNDSEPSPKDFILNLLNGKERFLIKPSYYNTFAYALADDLIKRSENRYHLVDWTRTLYHSLIFDIDIKKADGNTSDILLDYFYNQFLDVLEKCIGQPTLEIILSMRRSRLGGLHVHVVGFVIAHDDYIHLCSLMKSLCYAEKNNTIIDLDCPSTMCLVGSGKIWKSDNEIYEPVNMLHIQFPENREMERIVEKVDVIYDSKSLFEKCKMQMYIEIAFYMMPYANKKWKVLYYPTKIVSEEKENAHFMSFRNMGFYRFEKSNVLQVHDQQEEGSFCYQFLQQNYIKLIRMENRVIKTWYKRLLSNFNSTFEKINTRLRNECVHLKDEENPLKTILTNNEMVLPVYYALCNELPNKLNVGLDLIDFYEPVKFIIKKALENNFRVPGITFDTIKHCAFHTCPSKTKEGTFCEFIGMGWDWIFESTKTVEQIQAHVKYIQETHFPMVKGKNNLYVWNSYAHRWNVIKEEEVHFKITEIYHGMIYYPGFDKIFATLRNKLMSESNWIKEIVEDILKKLRNSPIINGNVGPNTLEEMKTYGKNVPEYLFLDWDIKEDDITCY